VRYKVMVDDNFHYMDDNERYEFGTFLNVEDAIAACKNIVESNLAGFIKPGMTAAELYDLYGYFGDDPFILTIVPNTGEVHFSAWHYAKERSDALAPASTPSVVSPPSEVTMSTKRPTARELLERELLTNPRFNRVKSSGQGVIIVGARATVEPPVPPVPKSSEA
jgi:hypothetical protein